jgi:hypothetical protein
MNAKIIPFLGAALLLAGCATKKFTYLKPTPSVHVYDDRWGAHRLFFKTVNPDYSVFIASTERSNGETLLIRVGVPVTSQFPCDAAVVSIEGEFGRISKEVKFERSFYSSPLGMHPTDLPTWAYELVPPQNPVFSHRIWEASISIPSSASISLELSGIMVDGQILPSERILFTRESGKFVRGVSLQ